MESVKRLVDRVLEVIAITLFLVMVGVTTWQVISRYVLNAPSSMTEEFVTFSLIWLSMLSAAYGVRKKSPFGNTLFSGKPVGWKKIILDILLQTGFKAFGAIVMVYGGFKAVSITIDQISPSLQISMGLVYLSLPVAGILMIFYSLINILELVKEKKAGLEA